MIRKQGEGRKKRTFQVGQQQMQDQEEETSGETVGEGWKKLNVGARVVDEGRKESWGPGRNGSRVGSGCSKVLPSWALARTLSGAG